MKKTKLFLLVLFCSCINAIAQVGINTPNPQGILNVDGAKNNAATGTPTSVQLQDDFIVTNTGSIGLGVIPDNYAMLDVSASNKGILAPRVNLTSSTLDLNADGDNVAANQPQGLLVYNIGTTLNKGYYYWNGSEWRVFDSSTAVAPVLGSLVCASSTLSPASYSTGVPYAGNLRVPYTGGNGGSYQPGTPITVHGLTFTLRASKLEFGDGELVFSVVGTPDTNTDFTVNLTPSEIPFLASGQQCTVTVTNQTTADTKNVAYVGTLVSTSDNGRTGYHLVGTTPDGQWSVRCFLPTNTAFQDVNLQLRYNGSASDPDTRDIIQNTTYMWGGGDTNSGNQVTYPKNIWAGSNANTSALSIATSQTATNFPNWGDPGVYAAARPEYRLYHWTDYSATGTKVFYTMEFMMGSSTPGANATTTTCPSGTCISTKVFFNLRQITAP
ncbi:hypothetical protein CLU97_0676 [Chryseobacterium sp. 7]|uniref:hypothetical protein n=1 Tax=Chryseobacterium sp. 7 TaxID=2035214 RepID=UPI000EAECF78|nr:hypothetical protein [Chryseobacterium sp. 7]RLJ31263.1 hypothetical protein CLU97_0676 [Chryseobacterium sp. 7]